MTGRPLTINLDQLRAVILSGATDTDAAAQLGITPRTCKRHRLRLGLRRPWAGGRPRGQAVVRIPVVRSTPATEPNTHLWQMGDVVYLDGVGEPLVVIGYNAIGQVVTVYQGEGRRRAPEFYTYAVERLYQGATL